MEFLHDSPEDRSLQVMGQGVAAGEEVSNKQIIFREFAEGIPKESDMAVKSAQLKLKVPEGRPMAVLVRNLYLSCDPFMRLRMGPQMECCFPPFERGLPLVGFGVVQIVDSTHLDFEEGELLWGLTTWEEFSLLAEPFTDAYSLFKIKDLDLPLSYHIGLLGMPGLSAYIGFYEICSPKKGEYVFVSAAAGAIGHLVGQFAKLMGCYVVGSAGSKEKVDLLKNKLGFDDAFNHNDEVDFDAALKRRFPEGIDIYFDNVGGDMLDAVLLNMRLHGRIAMSGMVSQYNLEQHQGLRNLFCAVTRRVRMEGFMIADYFDRYPEFYEEMRRYLKEGKIVYVEDVVHGIEGAPAALIGLLTGQNVGKRVVAVAPDLIDVKRV
ncbi:hypothetical protein H6P81_010713 [Aristolochia fimbriata]|uniref:Enoyl reductase (ER) domain-containing protein n=1 Tax=Aristolochia fimbriata TaxID=158543 RepID=A0AAV7EPS8_ARIFI|nr:hypothetical protein H6P81_010713 [Aristolochia fimbriata]